MYVVRYRWILLALASEPRYTGRVSPVSHDSLISSRSFPLSLFECFAPFLPLSRRRLNASTSLSVLVSAKSNSTISSRSSSGARGYVHEDETHGITRAHGVRDARSRHGGGMGRGRGGRRYDWNGFGRSWQRRDGRSRSRQNGRRGVMGWKEVKRGRKHLLGRHRSTERRARRDVALVVSPSPICMQLRSLFNRRVRRMRIVIARHISLVSALLVQVGGIPSSAEMRLA